jgi:hypothetical protein
LIQVRQRTPNSLFVNYSFNEASFIEIDIQAKSTRQGTKMGSWPEQLENWVQHSSNKIMKQSNDGLYQQTWQYLCTGDHNVLFLVTTSVSIIIVCVISLLTKNNVFFPLSCSPIDDLQYYC